MFKPAMLHIYRQFYISKPWHKKVNPKYCTISFFWNDSFEFGEKIIIDRDDVQKNLRAYKQQHVGLEDLFVPKYNWKLQKI